MAKASQITRFAKRHKVFTVILGLFILVVLIGATAPNNSKTTSSSSGNRDSSSNTNSGNAPSGSSSIQLQPQSPSAVADLQTQPPSCTSYQAIDGQTWLEIVKNPKSYQDQCFTVYGEVTQFDSVTGTGAFLADVGGVQQTPQYGFVDYPTNTYLTGSAATLNNVVEQDLFTANVMVLGTTTYETDIGGQITVPELQVNSIQVTGTVSD